MINRIFKTIRFLALTVVVTISAVMVGFVVVLTYDYFNRDQLIADILNISSAPESLKVIDCESPFTTDVLTTCVISIDPNEFNLLLGGYSFAELSKSGTSHSLVGPRLADEFEVSTEYMIVPKEFKYGGYVRILSDKDKKRAVIDLYIE